MTARPEGDFDDVIAFAWDGPAGSVADAARLLLLDSLGCMIAGLGHAAPRRFADALAITMPGSIRLPGCAAGLSEAGAAAVLASAMCWDEANEGLARAHGRPALAVAPLCIAALAAGRVAPGAVHAAFALGYEIAGRAGEIWRIRPGMHVDGSWHALGAAAAAVRLAGGDAGEVARAIRLAACQIPFALYAPIAAGMDGRNSYPAHAVLLGAMAAAAARAGMDAPKDGLAQARRIANAGNARQMRRWEAEHGAALKRRDASACALCGSTSGAAKRCSRCKTARFCGTECAAAAWPTHKAACNAAAKKA
jgi:2-methylcitrate dehydratase PrpD